MIGDRVDPVVAPPAHFSHASGMDARPDQFIDSIKLITHPSNRFARQ
jgi:hypothetical protein